MKVKLNGKVENIITNKGSLTLAEVIAKMGFNSKLIVVEFNGIIINKQLWENQKVKSGDILEIVTIVGGGS